MAILQSWLASEQTPATNLHTMKHIAFTPDRDTTWMERLTPALHASIYAMYAALERIATSSTHTDDRDIAHDALNTVFAWRAPVAVDATKKVN